MQAPKFCREPGAHGKTSYTRLVGLVLLVNAALLAWACVILAATQRVPCELAGEVVEKCRVAHSWSELGGFLTALGITLGGPAVGLYAANRGGKALEERK